MSRYLWLTLLSTNSWLVNLFLPERHQQSIVNGEKPKEDKRQMNDGVGLPSSCATNLAARWIPFGEEDEEEGVRLRGQHSNETIRSQQGKESTRVFQYTDLKTYIFIQFIDRSRKKEIYSESIKYCCFHNFKLC